MLDTEVDNFIEDESIKKDKNLYNSIQSQIQKILSKGNLPIFNIDNYNLPIYPWGLANFSRK